METRHTLKDPISVETKDGFESVSLSKGTCTCGQTRSGCSHFAEVRRWLNHFDRYLALSGFHKEIRRGDINRVRSWANIILLYQRPQTLLRYVERIIFEETRNIPLWIKLRKQELSLPQALEAICTSRKKWELNYLNQPSSHLENWHNGFEISNSRPIPVPLEMAFLLRTVRTAADAYGIYFDLRRDKQLRPQVLSLLEDAAIQTKNERLITFIRFKPSSSYEFMVALELLIDL